jgi:hypothetical protein
MYNRPGSGGIGHVPVGGGEGVNARQQAQVVQQIHRQQKLQQEHQYVNEFVQQHAARKEALLLQRQQQNMHKQQQPQQTQQVGRVGGIPEEPLSPPSGFKNNSGKQGQGEFLSFQIVV